jgi:alanyl-tRNA synthetase
MQQHTGQHVISAAFVHTGSYPTISVHQGEEYTTIEINAEAVPTADLDAVEDRANAMVAADAAVRDYIVDEAEIPGLELRRPPKVSGSIRIVEIEGYDRVACGGVHLARTGEVGWIKLVDTERIRGRVRSVWKIGARAVADYRLKTRVAAELTDRLSVQVPEIPGRVAKMQERIAEREWEIEQLKRRIAGLIAERLAAEAESAEAAVTGDLREEDAELLRSVVEHVVETQSRPAALTAPQEGRLRWCIGLPAESTVDVNKARSELLEPIAGKGGGKPPYFQGIAEKPEGAEEFFRRFAELVRRS